MLRRLVIGLFEGLLLGGLAVLALTQGLGQPTPGPLLAYGAAAATGLLTGLVAGRPFWRKGAAVEASVKACFGALLGVGVLFAVRRWLSVPIDLRAAGLGSGGIGDLAATGLPIVATVLALLFEIDNTGGEEPSSPRARIAAGPTAIDPIDEPDADADATRRAERTR